MRKCSIALGLILSLSLLAGCGHAPARVNTSSVTSSKARSTSSVESDSGASGVSSGSTASTASGATSQSSKAAVSTPGKTNPGNSNDPTVGVDLKGRTFKILSASGNIFPTGKGSTATDNAIIARTNKLTSALNCKIALTEVTGEQLSSGITSAVLNNDKYADIVIMPMYQAVGLIDGLCVAPFESVPTLDLKASYVNFGNMYTNTSIKGKHFYIGSEDFYFGSNEGVYFNKRLLKEANLEDPYTLVNNNQWTISKLQAMAKTGTKDKDGKTGMTKDDQWGMRATDAFCAGSEAFFSAMGGQMFKNNNGTITYNMDAVESIDIITKANQFYVGDKTAYVATDAELASMFMSGNGLFYLASGVAVKDIANMDDDFGFVPFPRGDSVANYSGIVNWNKPVIMIPQGLSAADLSDVGKFLQAFCYLSTNVANTEYQEYSDRYFRDDTSAQMLKKASQAQQMYISSILGSINLWNVHMGTYKVFYNCVSGSEDTSTYVNTNKSATVTALNDFLSSIK